MEIYYADRGDFPTAFVYADSALLAFQGDTAAAAIIEKAFLHHNMGMECFKIGDYDQSIHHYTEAAAVLELRKPQVVSVVFDGMAEVYYKLGQYDKSVEYDKKRSLSRKNMELKLPSPADTSTISPGSLAMAASMKRKPFKQR